MNISDTVATVIIVAIPLLFAISLHEAAHGYAARYFGDPTAAEQGRLSLNPLRHIDPFGTVLLPLGLWLTVGVAIGFAKPVPVDFSRLRNPHKQMAFVALAGPMANFAMGMGWMLLGVLVAKAGAVGSGLGKMIWAGMMINAAMVVFNLIPVPPLDGGRVVTAILPPRVAQVYAGIERYSLVLLIALVVLMHTGVLDGYFRAGMSIVMKMFRFLLSPITSLLN